MNRSMHPMKVNQVPEAQKRPQSFGEEIANSVSHGAGLAAALLATPFLVISTARRGGPWDITGAAVFSGTMILLYLASTLYHVLSENRAKRVFRSVDHGAIFLLIAGTYTPFTLGVLRGVWGWTLLGLVWTLAALGIVLEAVGTGRRYRRFSVGLYVAMGWLILIAIHPLLSLMPLPGILWLLAGGIAYTGGVAFYAAEHLRFSHFVWHLFVLAGTACHFFAVLRYATQ